MLQIIFFGSPEIAVPSLQRLHATHKILAVVTQPDRPSGRGQKLTPPPVKLAAEALGIPVLQPTKVRTAEFQETLRGFGADLFVVVAYGRILPPGILELPAYGCVNEHFSLLPKYRGAACIAYPLLRGESETGVTSMLMDEGLDTGPILLQWSEDILPEDRADTLAARLAELGAEQLLKTCEALERGNVQATPQREEEASFAPLLKKTEGLLDWTLPARELLNRYRGLTPWPGVYSFWQGKRVIFTKMRLAESDFGAETPGTLVAEPGYLGVRCGEGAVEILALKVEGKREMGAAEFLQSLPEKGTWILNDADDV